MKKALLILLAVGAAGSAGILIYTYWWATQGFDRQETVK